MAEAFIVTRIRTADAAAMLGADQLKRAVVYDPDTGQFTRLSHRLRRFVGSIAGHRKKHRAGRIYVVIMIDCQNYLAHRLAWLYMTGKWPEDIIDHIDGDGGNNKWANLREATQSQNLRNTIPDKTRVLPKGVSFRKKRFEASISIDRKKVYLGRFQTAQEASAAYREAATAHAGAFARFE